MDEEMIYVVLQCLVREYDTIRSIQLLYQLYHLAKFLLLQKSSILKGSSFFETDTKNRDLLDLTICICQNTEIC